jgi:MscS family membrane protein
MRSAYELIQASPALAVAAIIVATLLAGIIIDFITKRVLLRLTAKTATNLDDAIIAAIRKPLFLSVVMIGVWLVVWRLDTGDGFRRISRNLLISLAILFWAGAGMRIGRAVLQTIAASAGEHRYVQTRTIPLFDIGIRTVVIGGAAYGLLLAWHVDVTAWLASAGILGIAIGFAAKDTLANLFSGIFILADAPYKIGDYIVLDSGERGQVTEIGIRSTRILTRDDIQIIIHNAAIANAKIVNESGGPHPKERVRVNVGVAYGSDIDHVREVLAHIAEQSEYLVADPEPRVRFRELGDSSLNFQLLGWVQEPGLRGAALDELYTAVYKRFAQERITIPFPQRDVHLFQR